MNMRVTTKLAIGACCANSVLAGIGTVYVGGRGLYHLAERYWYRNDDGKVAELNKRLLSDWTSLKTALLALPPIIGIFLAAQYGNLGFSIGTSAHHSRSVPLLKSALEYAIDVSFFPLQADAAPDEQQAKIVRDKFIQDVYGEAVELDKGNNEKLPAVFTNKKGHPDTIVDGDLCIIMAHGNGMQLEDMEEYVYLVRGMDRERNSVLVYTLDGYGPNRHNGVKTCEESAKFDALAAVNYALQRGYKPEQIVFLGYSIGTVGAAAAAHLAGTHCILFKGFTTGADVARNVCSNVDRMLPGSREQRWFGNLLSWAQKQAGDFAHTLLQPVSGKVASRQFHIHGADKPIDVPINGMNNLWHVEQMHPDRFLLCIGGSQDHLMASEWDEETNQYQVNFAEILYESGTVLKRQKFMLQEGHIGDNLPIQGFLETVRGMNK